MIEREDLDHLEHASREGRVIFSFNMKDFNRLHRDFLNSGKSHSGIVVSRQQFYSVGEIMRRLLRIVAARPEGMKDQIEFLGSWG